MIEQETFKRHLVGRDGFQWWIGQVVDETSWIRNTPAKDEDSNREFEGYGARFKVRIMGYHTASKVDLPDEQLPWATVLYPTTAGAGGRNHSQSVMITQGSFVFGFFLDGENAQQPVIMGCMGFNDYQEIMKNVPDAVFKPFSGYGPGQTVGPAGEKAVPGGLTLSQSQSIAADTNNQQDSSVTAGTVLGQSNGAAGGGQNINSLRTETATVGQAEKASQRAAIEPETPLYKTKSGEPLPISTLHKQVRNAIQEVQRLRRTIYDISTSAQRDIGNLQTKINKALDRAAKFIAASMKDIYNAIMGSVLKIVNQVAKPILAWIPLDKRTLGEEALGASNNALVCGFKNLINLALRSIRNFLTNAVQRTINVPQCFINNFVASFLGAARGLISGIAGALQRSIGAIADAAMGVVDLVSDILSLVDNIFNFLSCETNVEESTVTEWSILGGQSTLGLGDIQGILDRANGLASNVTSIPGNISDAFSAAGDIDLTSMYNDNNCNTDARDCGPPIVEIFSSNGARAVANAVIGDLGEIIGVDMLSFGVGYDASTRAVVRSDCGNGRGAVLRPNIAGINTAGPVDWTAGAGDDPFGDGWAGDTETFPPIPSSTTFTGCVTVGSMNITDLEVVSGNLSNILPGSSSVVGCGATHAVVTAVTPTTIVVDRPFDVTECCTFTATNGNDRTGQITSVTVIDSGTGYLAAPDGSRGGDGQVWANANDTTVRRENGVWEVPIPPGWPIRVGPGDYVCLPAGTTVVTEPHQEEIRSCMTVEQSGTFTSPDPTDFDAARGTYPSDGSGAYPVILSLCEIIIEDAGVNYKQGDEIVIVPNNGAEAVPQIDRFGRVFGVKVTNPGEGFKTYPKIYIESDSGYNVELIPRFCIDRISEEKIQEVGKEKVLNVVDCVGRLPDELTMPCSTCNDTSMVW